MMQNFLTYSVLVASAFSLTGLAFMLYSAYGFAAVKAAAPFLGTLGLTFLVAHCLDRNHQAEDAKAEANGARAVGSSAAGVVKKGSSGGAGGPSKTLPKRRRVAD